MSERRLWLLLEMPLEAARRIGSGRVPLATFARMAH
jgi:hypothetical protein